MGGEPLPHHISCDLKWWGIILSDHGSICTAISHICIKRQLRTDFNAHEFFSTAFSHISWVLRQSGIKENSTEGKRSNIPLEVIKIMPVSMSAASSHISWVLKWSGTNLRFDRLCATASLHVSCVFKWSGICFNGHGFMPTAFAAHLLGLEVIRDKSQVWWFAGCWLVAYFFYPWNIMQQQVVQRGSADPLYDIPRYIFKQVTHFILNPQGRVRVCWWLQRTDGMPRDSSVSWKQMQNILKRSITLIVQVHHQDQGCSLYAQPLKQAQENFRTCTLKDNLS